MKFPAISWKSIFVGTALSLLIYLMLITLGVAIGLPSLITAFLRSKTGVESIFQVGSVVSALVSLFVGGYVAGSSSGTLMRQGIVQGLVVSSVFFLVLYSHDDTIVGDPGRGLPGLIRLSRGGGVGAILNTTNFRRAIGSAIQAKAPRSNILVITPQIDDSILRADLVGAKRILVQQAGMAPADADLTVQAVRQTLLNVASEQSTVLSFLEWKIFASLLLGSFAAALGARAGVLASERISVGKQPEHLARPRRAA